MYRLVNAVVSEVNEGRALRLKQCACVCAWCERGPPLPLLRTAPPPPPPPPPPLPPAPLSPNTHSLTLLLARPMNSLSCVCLCVWCLCSGCLCGGRDLFFVFRLFLLPGSCQDAHLLRVRADLSTALSSVCSERKNEKRNFEFLKSCLLALVSVWRDVMPSWETLKAKLTAEAQGPKWVIKNSIALSKYYEVAKRMWVELEEFWNAKNWRAVYVTAKKFMILTNESMPKHKNYSKPSQAENRRKLFKLKEAAIHYLEKSSAELEYICDTNPDAPINSPLFSAPIRQPATAKVAPPAAAVRAPRIPPAATKGPAATPAASGANDDAGDPELQDLMARLAGLNTEDGPSGSAASTSSASQSAAATSRQLHTQPQQHYVVSVTSNAGPARAVPIHPSHGAVASSAYCAQTNAATPSARDLARLAQQSGAWNGIGSSPARSDAYPQQSDVRAGALAQPTPRVVSAVPVASTSTVSSHYSPAMLANLAQRNGSWRGVNLEPIVFRARARPAGLPTAGRAPGMVRVQARVRPINTGNHSSVVTAAAAASSARRAKNYDHIHPDLRKHAIDQDFVKELTASGARVVECAKDGNCLFRAISCQLYGSPERHAEVRRKAVQYMRSQPERFKWLVDPPTPEQLEVYLRAREFPMRDGVGEWGDHPEILALEEVYDRPIEIYSHENGPHAPRKTHLTELPDNLKHVTPFRLTFHGDNHYNSVIMHRPGDQEHVPLRERNSRYLQKFRSS